MLGPAAAAAPSPPAATHGGKLSLVGQTSEEESWGTIHCVYLLQPLDTVSTQAQAPKAGPAHGCSTAVAVCGAWRQIWR